MIEDNLKQRCECLVVAMLGKDNAEAWWDMMCKKFKQTPREQWQKDPISVYDYLMSHYGGEW